MKIIIVVLNSLNFIASFSAQACCELDFYFSKLYHLLVACVTHSGHVPDVDFEKTYASVVGSLQKGGADTRYSFVNSTDYRQNNIQVKYQLQGVHRTLVHHYNDTINMLVISDNPTTSRIRVRLLVCVCVEPLYRNSGNCHSRFFSIFNFHWFLILVFFCTRT